MMLTPKMDMKLLTRDCVCSGLLCDMLWADPEKGIEGWSENDRGVSYIFGPDVVTSFLKKNQLDLVCRAHQVCDNKNA